LKAALEKKPGLETARFTLGLVYEETGRTEEAIASYRAEVEANAEAYRAAFNLAKLLQKSGRPQEAVTFFPKAAEAQSDFGTGQLYLAKALLDAGDLRGAEEWARRGLLNRPDRRLTPFGHYVLADVYNRLGRVADAERHIAAAKKFTHPAAHGRRGRGPPRGGGGGGRQHAAEARGRSRVCASGRKSRHRGARVRP
jgi:tetratricopeptide (TPR) repeat protein